MSRIVPEVKVYAVPKANRGRYRVADWDLRRPLFSCRVDVEESDDANVLFVQLLDSQNELIAQAPFDGEGGVRICSDSSRYFALVVQNGDNRAVLGIGFADSSDSFDLKLALQGFSRRKYAEQRMAEQQKAHSNWNNRMVAQRENHEGQAPPALAPPKSRIRDSDDEDEEFGDFQ